MPNLRLFDEEVGLFKRGSVVSVDKKNNIIKIRLSTDTFLKKSNALTIDVPYSSALYSNNGLFIGSTLSPGTPVVIGQGSGGQFYLVNAFAENLSTLPDVNDDEILIRSNDITKISINKSNSIKIGSDNSRIHLDTKQNFISTNFDNNFNFTQASYSINGKVKRDKKYNPSFDASSRYDDDNYESNFVTIGFDPSFITNDSTKSIKKNPPLVESRRVVFEFQKRSNVTNDLEESDKYSEDNRDLVNYSFPSRKDNKNDVLSLNLSYPNYLIEKIEGTVVDTFGNILDINRNVLPIGIDKNTILQDNGLDRKSSFIKMKEIYRKSVALHYEMNSRKDPSVVKDLNNKEDYSRSRSRFSIDIDKEGQFKINIPSSSEVGNLPLLTRYENYSRISTEDNNNPNKVIIREDGKDIFIESFAAPKFDINTGKFSEENGSIKIIDDELEIGLKDRITSKQIRHGTAYHDITATCYTHQKNDFIQWSAGNFFDVNSIPTISKVVNDKIYISGKNANAGGRSGNINLDGSIELNVGANTSDRQSLILDTAGGIVANVGRDLDNRSGVVSMDGDLILKIGGMGVSTDSRFEKQQNGHYGGVLDIRVINSGYRVAIFRFDDTGLKVYTPGTMDFSSGQGMRFTSDADISFECENLTMQGRLLPKILGGSL